MFLCCTINKIKFWLYLNTLKSNNNNPPKTKQYNLFCERSGCMNRSPSAEKHRVTVEKQTRAFLPTQTGNPNKRRWFKNLINTATWWKSEERI